MHDDPTLIAIAVVEFNGQFLVGLRPTDKVLGGFHEFPGGKVEPHETPQQAAVRECREETGLEVEVVKAFPEHVHHYAHDRVRLQFFDCLLKTPDKQPRAPFRWVQRSALPALQFPAGNQALLALLQVAD